MPDNIKYTRVNWKNGAEGGTPLNDTNLNKMDEAIAQLDNKTGIQLITYAELKILRDSFRLVPGKQYRIIDYITTTAQENTSSANHQFDIIVVADDEKTLDENARAIQHDGDTYFANSDLNTWEIKYSLDNNATRFVWADETNGKGVIYYMKDEFNNECPYDFKNIQFKRKISFDNGRPEYNEENGTDTWVYTFTANSYHISNDEWSELKDGSLEPPYGHQNDENASTYHDNVIKPYIEVMDPVDEDYTKCGIQYLNDNVFLGYYQEVGSDDPENYPYYYAYCSYGCKLGLNTYSNTFGYGCYYNTFGDWCHGNTFGYGCHENTLGDGCYDNIFGYSCIDNTLGNWCYFNTFGNLCSQNIFGYSCSENTFGDGCHSNTFGDGCHSNTFGNRCEDNTFGCSCSSNTFGNYCKNNTFGTNCWYNTFGTASGAIDKCEYNIIDSGCGYLYINSTDTSGGYLQNVHIHLGVKGNHSSDRLTIEVDRNLEYEYNVVKAGTTTVEV